MPSTHDRPEPSSDTPGSPNAKRPRHKPTGANGGGNVSEQPQTQAQSAIPASQEVTDTPLSRKVFRNTVDFVLKEFGQEETRKLIRSWLEENDLGMVLRDRSDVEDMTSTICSQQGRIQTLQNPPGILPHLLRLTDASLPIEETNKSWSKIRQHIPSMLMNYVNQLLSRPESTQLQHPFQVIDPKRNDGTRLQRSMWKRKFSTWSSSLKKVGSERFGFLLGTTLDEGEVNYLDTILIKLIHDDPSNYLDENKPYAGEYMEVLLSIARIQMLYHQAPTNGFKSRPHDFTLSSRLLLVTPLICPSSPNSAETFETSTMTSQVPRFLEGINRAITPSVTRPNNRTRAKDGTAHCPDLVGCIQLLQSSQPRQPYWCVFKLSYNESTLHFYDYTSAKKGGVAAKELLELFKPIIGKIHEVVNEGSAQEGISSTSDETLVDLDAWDVIRPRTQSTISHPSIADSGPLCVELIQSLLLTNESIILSRGTLNEMNGLQDGRSALMECRSDHLESLWENHDFAVTFFSSLQKGNIPGM